MVEEIVVIEWLTSGMEKREYQAPSRTENYEGKQDIDRHPETVQEMRLIVNEKQSNRAAERAYYIEDKCRDFILACSENKDSGSKYG